MNKKYAIIPCSVRSLRMPAAVLSALLLVEASAQLNMAAVNTPYTIDFDGTVAGVGSGAWAGAGFQPTPASGRLDSDAWAVTGWSDGNLAYGGTRITAGTDYRRGIALVPIATGGMYAFDDGAGGVLNGRALGFQPGSSDWAPGTITLRVQNNSGSTLTAFDIAYNVYYRDDQGRSNEFNLYVSDDDATYTHIASQDVVSPVGPGAGTWVANARSVSVGGFNVPNGQYFYVRWRGNDVGGSGSRDEFALDDISVTGRAYTVVRCTASTSSVIENVGTTNLTFSITNPDPVIATTVDLALTSGPAARINNYTTQTITFPGGSLANQSVTITVTDNGACDGNATEVFTLQNIAGGMGTPAIGSPGQHTMTIQDDETAPVSIAQFFDGGPGDVWTITGGGANQSTATGTGDTPLNERILSPTQSWQVSNASAQLDLGTISTLDWSSITLTARVSSTATSPAQGADGGDFVRFFVNLNGSGFPVTPDIQILGNSNARWGYSTGTGVASTTAGSPLTFQPAAGGNRTTDGYSFVSITIPNGTSTVALRVIAANDNTAEKWNIDDIRISGTLCSPIYYSRANGSEVTPTWSTSRTGAPAPAAVTFTKNASMVVQNTHTVTTTTNASIDLRNLNVENGGTLDLAGNCTIGINGPVFDVAGTLLASDDNFDLLSDQLTTISGTAGTIDVNNMTLDGFGAIVTVNTLKIRGTLQLDNGDFNANNKEVQLISTSTGTARLGPVAPTASYTSRLRVERYIPAGVTDWRLLASPVAGKTVSDWTDDFYTAGFPGSYYPNFYVNAQLWPSVRMYDETNPGALSTDGLIGVGSVSEPLTPGKGFAAWSGTTLSSTSAFTIDVRGLPTIASSPFSIPLTYTNNGFAAVDGLNLVGNPLPSPVDFSAFTLTNVDNNYYIYDPGSGTNAAWDENTLIGTGGANGNIQSSQGFWLKANAASPSATLTESAKVLEPINGGIFSDQQDQRPMVRLFLSDEAHLRTDESVVHFILGDPGYGFADMVKLGFANDSAALISTKTTSGEDLVINAYGELTGPVDVPVRVQVPFSGEYTVSFGSTAWLAGRACVTFEDLLTGTVVPVMDDADVTFTIDAQAPTEPARFVLHVGHPVSLSHTDASCAGMDNGVVQVAGPGTGPWTFTLTGGDGSATTMGPMTGEASFADLAEGDYQVMVDGNTGCGSLVQTVHIDAPGPLDGEISAQQASCADATDGTADLMVMGGTGPYTYAWSNGGTDEDLVGVGPGSYAVVITDANGCEASLGGVVVSPGPGPVASFEVSPSGIIPEMDVYFFNTGTYGGEYTWDFGDGQMSTENEPVHQFDSPGTYTITLTTTVGECTAVQSQEVLVSGNTGLAGIDQAGVSAWTNGSQFIVTWDVDGTRGITAEVLDATGRSVANRTALGSNGRITMSGQDLPSGVYVLRVRAAGTDRTFKLVLAH